MRRYSAKLASRHAVSQGIGVAPILDEDRIAAERYQAEKEARVEAARRACTERRQKRRQRTASPVR